MFPNLMVLFLGFILALLYASSLLSSGNSDHYWNNFFIAFIEPGKIYAISVIVAHASIAGLSATADRLKLIDKPDNNRKIHTVAKPLVGGLGIIAGVLAAMMLCLPFGKYVGLIFSIMMILTIGVIDDRYDINFKWRFIVQIAATAITMIYFPGMYLRSFGNLFGSGVIDVGILVIPVTIFCVLGVINAINMIDGLDGLAGGVSLVAFSAFSILAWINNTSGLMFIGLAFAGALAAFLRFNWHPSKLFMGDAGSMTLGFVLAFFSVEITQKPDSHVSPIIALFILAVPITDTLTVMTRRIMNKRSPFKPDNTHLHHLLKALGLSHTGVVIVMIGLSAIFSMIAIIGTIISIPDYVMFAMFILWFAYYFISSYDKKGIFKVIERIADNKIIALK